MNNKDIKNSLRNAVSDLTPNLFDKVVSSPIPEAEPQKPNRLKFVSPTVRNTVLVLAACIAVIVVSLNSIVLPQLTSESVVMLDINPSISLRVDADGEVLACDSINEDAKDILGALDLEGTNLDDAVEGLIDRLAEEGYLKRKKDGAMLISVENNNKNRARAIKKQTVSDVREGIIRNKAKVKVLSQTVEEDKERQEKALKYGISDGKAALIEKIIEQDTSVKFKKLAKMTIKELDRLTVKKKIKIDDTVEMETVDYKTYRKEKDDKSEDELVSSEAESQYEPPEETGIGSEVCTLIALDDAGTDSETAEDIRVYLNHESGNLYEIEFTVDDTRYYYAVRADTGEILVREKHADDDGSTVPESTDTESTDSETVSSELAVDATVSEPDRVEMSSYVSSTPTRAMLSPHTAALIAGAHADVKMGQDFLPTVDLFDNAFYIVEFESEGTTYVYKIDAYTGALLD